MWHASQLFIAMTDTFKGRKDSFGSWLERLQFTITWPHHVGVDGVLAEKPISNLEEDSLHRRTRRATLLLFTPAGEGDNRQCPITSQELTLSPV